MNSLDHYLIIWITRGSCKVKQNFLEYDARENTFLTFSPYQPFELDASEDFSGKVIRFHQDFFCIYKHHKDISCNGVLFNDLYGKPVVALNSEVVQELSHVLHMMKMEIRQQGLAQYELLVSYLKIIIITLTRWKTQNCTVFKSSVDPEFGPFYLEKLKDLIEANYRQKHSAADYADMLAISTKALGKITKKYFGRTLTDLISERIMIEAKKDLYLTAKSIKEIAFELGYQDEYYFSRFFKRHAGISPQIYRKTVGFNRG